MVWTLTLLPALAGLLAWAGQSRLPETRQRAVLGTGVAAGLLATTLLAIGAARVHAEATYAVGGGLELRADLSAPANVVAILVPAVGALVVAYAAVHEPLDGLGRLVGLLSVFVGAMQLLVTAADLLTLTVAFELVGGLSWALIGHEWRDPATPRAAAHAFNATRFGGLGLFLAAGAAFASTGTFAFDALGEVAGADLHVVAAGVLVASAAKSAQGPFAPWLFSAMAGPTPVSALLHSSTMVAAGAYVLARLHPVLEPVSWFGPTTIAVGLVTALAGGVVALLQSHAKKLLAASTSAQYGLMFVAVGAGYPAVAVLHLVVHAAFKAHLFLAAGTAIAAVGSSQLGRMRLGSHLRATAGMAAIGALALAAVPPLGGAYSKESIVAAAGHRGPWLAVLVIGAGALSAAYAVRFQVLAFGRHRGDDPPVRQLIRTPSPVEQASMAALAAASLGLGVLWVPPVHDLAARLLGGELASGPAWELVLSIVAVVAAGYAVWVLDRSHRLGHVGTTGTTAAASEWLGLPEAIRRVVVDPTLAAASLLAGFDDRVVASGVQGVAGVGVRASTILAGPAERGVGRAVGGVAGTGTWLAANSRRRAEPAIEGLVGGVVAASRMLVRGTTLVVERGVDGAVTAVAWLVDRAGADARRVQTGQIHHQFVVIAVGLGLVVLAAVTGR